MSLVVGHVACANHQGRGFLNEGILVSDSYRRTGLSCSPGNGQGSGTLDDELEFIEDVEATELEPDAVELIDSDHAQAGAHAQAAAAPLAPFPDFEPTVDTGIPAAPQNDFRPSDPQMSATSVALPADDFAGQSTKVVRIGDHASLGQAAMAFEDESERATRANARAITLPPDAGIAARPTAAPVLSATAAASGFESDKTRSMSLAELGIAKLGLEEVGHVGQSQGDSVESVASHAPGSGTGGQGLFPVDTDDSAHPAGTGVAAPAGQGQSSASPLLGLSDMEVRATAVQQAVVPDGALAADARPASRFRRVVATIASSVLLLLLGGCCVVVFLAGGRVDSGILQRVLALHHRATFGSVELTDIRAVSYPTRTRGWVLAVFGQAVNHGDTESQPLDVLLEINAGKGNQPIKARGPIGFVLSAAEIAELSDEASVSALYRRKLANGSGSQAKLVAKGRAPFTLVVPNRTSISSDFAQAMGVSPADKWLAPSAQSTDAVRIEPEVRQPEGAGDGQGTPAVDGGDASAMPAKKGKRQSASSEGKRKAAPASDPP